MIFHNFFNFRRFLEFVNKLYTFRSKNNFSSSITFNNQFNNQLIVKSRSSNNFCKCVRNRRHVLFSRPKRKRRRRRRRRRRLKKRKKLRMRHQLLQQNLPLNPPLNPPRPNHLRPKSPPRRLPLRKNLPTLNRKRTGKKARTREGRTAERRKRTNRSARNAQRPTSSLSSTRRKFKSSKR